MSEEEIIDILENVYIFKNTNDNFTNLDLNAIKGLLDLYYKQQKEIEEIKEEYKNEQLAELKELNNYIRKDKIKKILNNTEKNIEEDRPSIVLENLILHIKELLGE